MKKRLLTGIFIILALAATLFLRSVSPFIADAVIVALSTIACLEVSKAFNKGLRPCNTLITAIYPILLYVGFFIGIMNEVVFYYYIIYYLVVALVCLLFNFLMPFFFRKETEEEIKNSSNPKTSVKHYAWDKTINSMIVFAYPAMLSVPYFVINHLADFSEIATKYVDKLQVGNFIWFLIACLLAVTILTDTGAYLVGSALKGPKLCPTISPKKTISGAIGGLIFGIFGAFAVSFAFFSWVDGFELFLHKLGGTTWTILLIGMIGSVLTQLGDILASLIKRKCGIKDYGNILPGHGGIMDRIDGQIFNALFLFILGIILL